MVLVDSIVGWAGLVLALALEINPHGVPNAKVRYHLQTGAVSRDSGGHIPAVWLKDTSNRPLGSYTNFNRRDKKDYDQYWNYDIETSQTSELKTLNVRAEWTYYDTSTRQFRSGPLNDGICIAYMSWTPEDTMFNSEGRRGAITGDLFYHCGYDWYHSAKTKEINGQTYDLRCGWMDGDNSSGNSVHAMFLNTDILGKGYIDGYSKRNPNFSDICYWGVGFSKGPLPRKRSASEAFGNKAFITAGEGAISLCDSPTSWGPSMLSLAEGIFCDMETKTKTPICRDGQTTGCMKYDRVQGKVNARGRRGPPQRFLASRNVTRAAISFDSFKLDYFVRSYTNGTVLDDGTDV
ncbi:hypothetical protein BGW38_010166 [Lunasporangiospora selenospora]|uniref:Uncharacterized protein n=1 Tax=Lunasporangiospora selenospora TaxID=979761 RepID=A0A9P6G371_9FUNG|nr:hypothetical protein BGW38_010166 [Lunasporangiospora selenospora]